MASSELLGSSRQLMVFAAGSLPCGQSREGPWFELRVCRSVPSPVPRRTGWWLTVRLPPVLPSSLWDRLGVRGYPTIRFMWGVWRGCRVRLMLRPGSLA